MPKPNYTSLNNLTDTEKQIIRCVGNGESNTEIALKLGISVDAVGSRLKIIYEKVCPFGRFRRKWLLANASKILGSSSKDPEEEEPFVAGRGFHSERMRGTCQFCQKPMKGHTICNACGAVLGGLPHSYPPTPFRDKVLCGPCRSRWLTMDKQLGREATWEEMMKGIPFKQALFLLKLLKLKNGLDN